jgi:hypothetical protein
MNLSFGSGEKTIFRERWLISEKGRIAKKKARCCSVLLKATKQGQLWQMRLPLRELLDTLSST